MLTASGVLETGFLVDQVGNEPDREDLDQSNEEQDRLVTQVWRLLHEKVVVQRGREPGCDQSRHRVEDLQRVEVQDRADDQAREPQGVLDGRDLRPSGTLRVVDGHVVNAVTVGQ